MHEHRSMGPGAQELYYGVVLKGNHSGGLLKVRSSKIENQLNLCINHDL